MTTPATVDKPLVSSNGTAKSKPESSSSEINKLLAANTTLAVWLIFYAIGGGILALYYSQIGYLPEMEWKTALIYLFIGSVVGIVIGLLLTISLFIPGVLWSDFIIHDPCLEFFYTVPGSEVSGNAPVTELCLRSIIRYLGYPFLVALLLSHVALPMGKKLYWVFSAALLVFTFVVMRHLFGYKAFLVERGKADAAKNEKVETVWKYVRSHLKSDLSEVKRKLRRQSRDNGSSVDLCKENLDRQIFNYSSWFTLSVLLNQISMYVIYWLSGRPGQLSSLTLNTWVPEFRIFLALAVICTPGVWITNHVVALRHRDHSRQAIVAALVASGLLLFTADHFSSLSMKLMKRYGFGQTVNLLLTDDGVTDATNLKLCNSNCTSKTLERVEILSKVGDHYFLKADDGSYFTLPKKDVTAIKRLAAEP